MLTENPEQAKYFRHRRQLGSGALIGASVVFLSQSLSVSTLDTPLLIAVFCAAIVIPLLSLIFIIDSETTQFGTDHLRLSKHIDAITAFGATMAIFEVGAVFWHFCYFASIIFGALSFMCLLLFIHFNSNNRTVLATFLDVFQWRQNLIAWFSPRELLLKIKVEALRKLQVSTLACIEALDDLSRSISSKMDLNSIQVKYEGAEGSIKAQRLLLPLALDYIKDHHLSIFAKVQESFRERLTAYAEISQLPSLELRIEALDKLSTEKLHTWQIAYSDCMALIANYLQPQ